VTYTGNIKSGYHHSDIMTLEKKSSKAVAALPFKKELRTIIRQFILFFDTRIIFIFKFAYQHLNVSILFIEVVCKLGSFHSHFNLAHCPKELNLHTNELNTTFFFCTKSPLKSLNRFKSLKLA
jgi:hypothetical protein